MVKALISGVSGQDGSYLAEHLLEEGYEVHGIVRRLSVSENQSTRLENIKYDIQLHYGDLLDEHSLYRIINQVKPDVIYNLAAMSHVRISSDIPSFTIKTNSLGVLNILEASRQLDNVKIYQASSSEMFGNSVDNDGFQRLTTPMHPVSPYGCSKLLGFNLTNHYRNAYKTDVRNGILFNHESPRRGSNFVTNKIIKTAVEIFYKKEDKLVLGNLNSYRDWGHSYDYVRAMKKIMDYPESRDWIVATGENHSVRELCLIVFDYLKLNYYDYVTQDPKFMRPEELKYLRGDSSETREKLDWKPIYTFKSMIEEMVEFWLKELKDERN